jgi:hypothetical protein
MPPELDGFDSSSVRKPIKDAPKQIKAMNHKIG